MPTIRRRLGATFATSLAGLALALPAAAHAAPSVIGFNNSWSPESTLNAALPRAQHVGANSNRIMVSWRALEPTEGHYDWGVIDTSVAAMRAAGERPLIAVFGAPDWARAPGCAPDAYECAPAADRTDEFAALLRAMVQRYPGLRAVEIGNEMNLHHWWTSPSPAAYAPFLRAGYTAVKSVDPSVKVVIGGLCTGANPRNGDIPAGQYLSRLYDAGIAGSYDAIGYHVYVGGRLTNIAPDVKSALADLRGARNHHFDPTPLWITETGFPSSGTSPYGGWVFSEAGQAEALTITYRVLASFPDVQAVYFFRLADAPNAAPLTTHGFYRSDMTAKPAVEALRAAIANPSPWPNYTLKLKPRTANIYAKVPFKLSASGFNGTGARFEWVRWNKDHWSQPLATTTSPKAKVTLKKVGKMSLAVRLVTSRDTYLSQVLNVNVAPKPKPKPKRKKARAKAARRHKTTRR